MAAAGSWEHVEVVRVGNVLAAGFLLLGWVWGLFGDDEGQADLDDAEFRGYAGHLSVGVGTLLYFSFRNMSYLSL